MRGTLVHAVAELAQRQHGAITTYQLRRLGVSARAQRTAERDGWLTIVEPGVAVLGATADTWIRRLQIGLLALDGRGWVSHGAAAALYGLDAGTAEPVEFTVPRAARGLRSAARVHTTAAVGPTDVRRVRGLRCSSPERTIIDLAHDGASPDRLKEVLVWAERRGLTTGRQVAARLAELRGPGRWGARPLDRVLAGARPRPGVRAA